MMWKLLFLLLATAVAADRDEGPRCQNRVFEACKDVDARPDGIPGNEEELEAFCNYAVKYMDCANKVVENCEEEEHHLVTLRELTANVIRVCDKDSLVYNALAGVVPCFKEKETELFDPCPDVTEENRGTVLDTLAGIGITDVTASDDKSASCLEALYYAACFGANAGKICGDVGREVAIDIIQGYGQSFESCPPGMVETLPTIAQVMQLEAEKEEALDSKIKKRK